MPNELLCIMSRTFGIVQAQHRSQEIQ